MATDDPFKGLQDLQRQRAEVDATIQQVGRDVAREKESQRAQEASRHAEVVRASEALAELLDDVAAATTRVDGSVRHVEDAVRHVEDAVGGMREDVSAAVNGVERAVVQMREDVRESLGEVTTAVNNMNRATGRLMWVSIGVAALAILVTVLTAVF